MAHVIPASILYKSIEGRYRPVRVTDGPIVARYRFIKNAYWHGTCFAHHCISSSSAVSIDIKWLSKLERIKTVMERKFDKQFKVTVFKNTFLSIDHLNVHTDVWERVCQTILVLQMSMLRCILSWILVKTNNKFLRELIISNYIKYRHHLNMKYCNHSNQNKIFWDEPSTIYCGDFHFFISEF